MWENWYLFNSSLVHKPQDQLFFQRLFNYILLKNLKNKAFSLHSPLQNQQKKSLKYVMKWNIYSYMQEKA